VFAPGTKQLRATWPCLPGTAPGVCRAAAFIEALHGLRPLPPRGAWFLFLLIRRVGGTGAPGRALAVLPGLAA
jgi:hypothetical protein